MHTPLTLPLILTTLLPLLPLTVLSAPTALAPPSPFTLDATARTAGDNDPKRLIKRNVGGVRLCTGSDWTGWCDYVIWPLNECISLND